MYHLREQNMNIPNEQLLEAKDSHRNQEWELCRIEQEENDKIRTLKYAYIFLGRYQSIGGVFLSGRKENNGRGFITR